MIDHEHKCIFIHQRKCAGVTISRAFGYDDISVMTPAWCFMNDGVLSPEFHIKPPNYMTFAIVRNPWDRFVSGWKFCEKTRDLPIRQVLDDVSHRQYTGWEYQHIARPQHITLITQGGHLVAHHLLRFEKLQEDFDALCEKIKKPKIVLEHANPSARLPDHREYFQDQYDRDLFLRLFGRDVDAFGYEF